MALGTSEYRSDYHRSIRSAVRHHVAWGIDWFVRVAPGKKRGRREAFMPRAQIKDEQAHRNLRMAELIKALRDR